MSMNFYIEILSPRVPGATGKGNKRGDLRHHNDVRYCNARWPIYSFILSLLRSIFFLKCSALSNISFLSLILFSLI